MRLMYTFHAQEQIKEREILEIWVEETIKFPDITKHLGNKYIVTKKLNGIILEVVYIKEKYIRVITCYLLK